MDSKTAGGGSATGPGGDQQNEEAMKEKVVTEFMQMMEKSVQPPKPGLSNEAKQAKDLLTSDPYNMQNICRLGVAYAKDQQWQQCVNVLLRGWKRTKEFENPLVRFEYLSLLTQGSFQLRKFRQALAVLEDMEEAPQEVHISAYNVLRCQVYCANNDAQRGLKAFHNAIDGVSFTEASANWAACLEQLKKVGLVEVTRDKMKSLAPSDEEQAKLEAMEKIVEVKNSYKDSLQEPTLKQPVRIVLGIASGMVMLSMCYGLYLLEQQNLAGMKW